MSGKNEDQQQTPAARMDSAQDGQVNQQQMNAQAQQGRQRPQGRTIKMPDGSELPFTPAPVGHATGAMVRNAQRARDQELKNAKVDLPPAATPEAMANTSLRPMPAGGVQQLAEQVWPGDYDNQEAMDSHVFDLMLLNRDSLRTDTDFQVGQLVRVPNV